MWSGACRDPVADLAGRGRALRILHTPKNPSGLAGHLAEAERGLGAAPTVITTRRDFMNREVDLCHELQTKRGPSYVAGHVRALGALPPADVINLWYGATFLHWPRFGASLLDLGYLRRNAPLIATYVGSDARRMLGRGGALQRAAEESLGGSLGSMQLRWLDVMQGRAIDKMADAAGHLFAVNPDLLRDLPAEVTTFLPYPVAVDADRAGQASRSGGGPVGRPLRVLHAPSNAALKGTRFVEAAVERIEHDLPGRLDYRRASALTYSAFLDELAEADLFIDQLLIGWYGVSVVEAMLVGTPSLCYLDEQDLGAVPPEMAAAIPVVDANPSTVEATLRRLLDDPGELGPIATAGRAYAKRWHDPAQIAPVTLDRYQAVIDATQ